MSFKKIIKKIFGCKHNFTDYRVGFQALNDIGIAYDFKCEKCNEIWHVNLKDGIDLKEFMKDDSNLITLNKFIIDRGFTAGLDSFTFDFKDGDK